MGNEYADADYAEEHCECFQPLQEGINPKGPAVWNQLHVETHSQKDSGWD